MSGAVRSWLISSERSLLVMNAVGVGSWGKGEGIWVAGLAYVRGRATPSNAGLPGPIFLLLPRSKA